MQAYAFHKDLGQLHENGDPRVGSLWVQGVLHCK